MLSQCEIATKMRETARELLATADEMDKQGECGCSEPVVETPAAPASKTEE